MKMNVNFCPFAVGILMKALPLATLMMLVIVITSTCLIGPYYVLTDIRGQEMNIVSYACSACIYEKGAYIIPHLLKVVAFILSQTQEKGSYEE